MAARIPQIHISLKDVDGMWHLSVADNGLELTQEKADLFFEPLHTGKMSGMGLGLSLWRISPSAIKATPWRPRTPRSVTAA